MRRQLQADDRGVPAAIRWLRLAFNCITDYDHYNHIIVNAAAAPGGRGIRRLTPRMDRMSLACHSLIITTAIIHNHSHSLTITTAIIL